VTQDERLREAILRGQRVLFSGQREDGSWDERSNIGASATANVLVALHWAKMLPEADLKDGARWLRSQQRKDGSFDAHPFANKGDLGTTAQAWAALHLAPGEENARAAANAASFVRANGGVDAVLAGLSRGDLGGLYLALAGLVDGKRLPSLPLSWVMVPPLVDAMSRRFHFGIVMGAIQMTLISKRLHGKFGKDGKNFSLLERVVNERAVSLLTIFQNPDGSWNSNTVQTAPMIPALLSAGLAPHDRRVRKACEWLLSRRVEDPNGIWFDVFAADVWATAFYARALMRGGVPAGDPRIVKAIEWMLSRQLDTPQPEVDNRQPNAVRVGGWPFQTGNLTMADCDDTGVVLSAFGAALEDGSMPPELAARVRTSVTKARAWLDSMQNPDGGWAAFVWSLPGKRPQRRLFTKPIDFPMEPSLALLDLWRHPPPELGDPATEGVTARVMHGLAANGSDVTHPTQAKAVRFLREHQTDFGGWWGRWITNYLAATSFVVSALAKAREDLDEEYVQRAIHWLLSRQNNDGGFGETTASYVDISKAGKGPSNPPQTALVTMALVDAGKGSTEQVKRAVDYLLATQRPDGTWPNDRFLLCNIPPSSFYFFGGNAKHLPLEALSAYAHQHATLPPAERHGRWSSEMLKPFRRVADDLGDSVVAEIFKEGDLATINTLLGSILENDDPIPSGLPDRARKYFDDTDALPTWADPVKIARAQNLFATHGVYITYALFCSSLPQAYASADGAEVLVQTGAMLARVRQRIFETAQFLFDVLDEGSLSPGGRGIRAAQRVRLMHAAIRHLILQRKWDVDQLGLPINQEDMAGTLMTFSTITYEGLQRFGLTLSREDGDAWIHHWNIIGHFLGVREELMPRNLADATQLTQAIRERQWARSKQGRQLTAALVDMMQEFFTRNEPVFDGLMPTVIRYLSGDLCADLLGLPPNDWTVTLVEAFTDITDVFDQSTPDELVQRELGKAALTAMRFITDVERGHKNASFRIPESLKRSVVPGS
jgi:squalene cyclase